MIETTTTTNNITIAKTIPVIKTTSIKIDNTGIYSYIGYCQEQVELERYIINENATILFWNDDTKTISKRDKEDKFDKELGYLYAYFYKKCGYNKSARKRILDCIDEKKIKTFLLEFYVKTEDITKEQAKKYLSNLKVEK